MDIVLSYSLVVTVVEDLFGCYFWVRDYSKYVNWFDDCAYAVWWEDWLAKMR